MLEGGLKKPAVDQCVGQSHNTDAGAVRGAFPFADILDAKWMLNSKIHASLKKKKNPQSLTALGISLELLPRFELGTSSLPIEYLV